MNEITKCPKCGGEYVDEIFMNVLKEDFYKNQLVKKLHK